MTVFQAVCWDNHFPIAGSAPSLPIQSLILSMLFSLSWCMLCEMLAADSFSWNRFCFPFTLFSLSNPSAAQHCLSIFFQGCLSWKGLIFVFEIGFQSDFRLGARRKKSSLLVSGDHGASWGSWRVGE